MQRVYLKPNSLLTHYTDPRTRLVVTHAPQEVDDSLIGSGCRACREVLIEPVVPVLTSVEPTEPTSVEPAADPACAPATRPKTRKE